MAVNNDVSLHNFTDNKSYGGSGGGPFSHFLRTRPDPTERVSRIVANFNANWLRGIHLTYTDGSKFNIGVPTEIVTKSIDISGYDVISSIRIRWKQFRFGATLGVRIVGLLISTRSGAKLDIQNSVAGAESKEIDVGSGICYGIFGRNGAVIDQLGFVMLRAGRAPTKHIPIEDIHNIIREYAPIFRLHPDEKYLPTSVEQFDGLAVIREKATNTTQPLDLESMPTDGDRHQIEISNAKARDGDLNTAVSYVHARAVDSHFTELQFWIFYGFNGAGTSRVKTLVFNWTVHSGNSSLTPLGEHEGDWEHVTLKIANSSLAPTDVLYNVHGDATWHRYEEVEKGGNGKQPIAYSSRNGHGSYPGKGPNYINH